MATLELIDIQKHFGPVHAVRGASLAVQPGTIHAVVGENGAGKSTLLKIAAGIALPDAGRVLIDGEPLAPHSAAAAIARGVGMVQQHFALIGVFTVLENLVLGREPVHAWGHLDLEAARKAGARVARELGVTLPLDARTDTLGVGDRQRVEVARTLMREASILVLDEPTAVLTPGEVETLYATLRRLASAGRAIVVVTHKLDEVEGHADEVTVMRRGEVVHHSQILGGSKRVEETARLTAAIMGGHMAPIVRDRNTAGPPGEVRLAVQDVSLGRSLTHVSFEVRAGEVVGIAGVDGNGQRELVLVLSGLEAPDTGTVDAGGAARVSVVHEDRHGEGLVLDALVLDNLLLGELARFTRAGLLDETSMAGAARERVTRFDVQPPDLGQPVRALSGGNQQKVVVARAITRAGAKAVIVVAHPTRGVDLGASRTIHARLVSAAQAGAAVLVVSADLEELRAIADRILVMARGRIVAELPPTSSDAEIGAHMVGASAPSPEARGGAPLR